MEAELRTLEDKVNQVAALCQRLRADNHDLRQQLATALHEKKQLAEKMGAASARLETLLTQIPADEA